MPVFEPENHWPQRKTEFQLKFYFHFFKDQDYTDVELSSAWLDLHRQVVLEKLGCDFTKLAVQNTAAWFAS